MRVIATVELDGPVVPLRTVHTGARPALYGVLQSVDPDVATVIHEQGWERSGRKPWSVWPPERTLARGEMGLLIVATPVLSLAEMFAEGFTKTLKIHWGASDLSITSVRTIESPVMGGAVTWSAVTPTVVQANDAPLLPVDDGWGDALRASIVHAAEYLGVETPEVTSVNGAGRLVLPVDKRNRACARSASMNLKGDPKALTALADMGLGWRATEGFGFVVAKAAAAEEVAA